MRKAIAIAIVRNNPLTAVLDFMYGTKQRARATTVFAFALLILGFILNNLEAGNLLACPA